MEYSLYEKNHPRRKSTNTGTALGRITKVYADSRQVEVKTFFGEGSLNDNHIPKAQWVTSDGHPDGDESGSIPRVGAMCIVHYIGGQPFVHGMIKPLTEEGSAVKKKESDLEELSDGDRVFKTNGLNKIILRSNGEIQIQSTEGCKTLYTPNEVHYPDLMSHQNRNYEFRTTGGTIDWKETDLDKGTTNSTTEHRDDSKRTNVLIDSVGTPIDDQVYFFKRQLGGGDPEGGVRNVVYTTTIKNTGETELYISAAGAEEGHHMLITPDGRTQINIGGSYKSDIKSTGETTIDINKKLNLNIKPNGTTTLDIGPGKVKLVMTSDGVTTLNSTGAKLKFSQNKIEMGSDSIQLLAKIIEELGNIISFIGEAKNHVHEGNLGYPSMIPTDQSPWETMLTSTNKVKSDITTLKGSL